MAEEKKRRCIDIITEKHPKLDADDLVEYSSKLEELAEKYPDPAELKKAQKELLDKIEIVQLRKEVNDRRQQLQFEVNKKYVDQEAFKNRPDQSVLSTVEGTNIPAKGGLASAERLYETRLKTALSNLHDDLIQSGHKKQLDTKELEEGLHVRSLDIRKEGSLPHKDKAVEDLSQVFRKHFDIVYHELKRVGVDIGYLDSFGGHRSWDPKQMTDKKQWVDDHLDPKSDLYIGNELGIGRSFKDVKSEKKIRKIMENIYDNIKMASSGIKPPNPKKKSSLSMFESSRVIHFENPKNSFASSQKYGPPGFYENAVLYMEQAYRRIALIEKYGPDYVQGFEDIRHYVESQHIDNARVREAMARARDSFDMLAFPNTVGYTPEAKLVQMITEYVAISSLGRAINVATFGDLAASGIALRTATGQNMLSATGKAFKEFAVTLGDDWKFLMHEFKLGADLEIANQWRRYSTEGVDGFRRTNWDNFKMYAFQATGLPFQYAASRATNARLWGLKIEELSQLKYDDLPKDFIKRLEGAGVEPEMWEILRTAEVRYSKKQIKAGITLNAMHMLPDDKFPSPIEGLANEDYKRQAIDAMTALFFTQFDIATPIPKTKQIRQTGGNLRPDSPAGMASKMVRQFKGVPFKVGADAISHVLYASGEDKLANMFNPKKIKENPEILNGWWVFGQVAAQLTLFGYLSMLAAAAIAGQEPPDPEDPATWLLALTKGGVLGMTGDLLLSEYEKNYRSLLGDLAGPSLSRINEGLETIAKLRAGKDVSESEVRQMWRNLPLNNHILFPVKAKEAIIEGWADAMGVK